MDNICISEQINYNEPHFNALEKLEELITLLKNIKAKGISKVDDDQYRQLNKLTSIVHDYNMDREYDSNQETRVNSNTALVWATNVMARCDGFYKFVNDDDDYEDYLI